jgi:hypothetical protein
LLRFSSNFPEFVESEDPLLPSQKETTISPHPGPDAYTPFAALPVLGDFFQFRPSIYVCFSNLATVIMAIF